VGEEGLFEGGCPICGYSAPPAAGTGGRKGSAHREAPGNLSLWVYILAGSILLAFFVFLFFTLVA
jgi:hypothetical protein